MRVSASAALLLILLCEVGLVTARFLDHRAVGRDRTRSVASLRWTRLRHIHNSLHMVRRARVTIGNYHHRVVPCQSSWRRIWKILQISIIRRYWRVKDTRAGLEKGCYSV
ncbi:hypothetical protein C8T65DRAFT_286681 [Cerioporus squamosus]|nr:hypothetical protein C8T65DRAFT_286681 [Cerioporus squamosus]